MLALIGLAPGCAYQNQYRDAGAPDAAGGIAVVPFENLTGYPHAGHILAELFESELRAAGRREVVHASLVAARLAPHEGKVLPPDELGRLLGVDTLVLGRATEYTYKSGLGEDPAVGMSVQVVDAASGRVIWSGARSQTGRYAWIKEDSLSRVAQVVCRELVDSFVSRR